MVSVVEVVSIIGTRVVVNAAAVKTTFVFTDRAVAHKSLKAKGGIFISRKQHTGIGRIELESGKLLDELETAAGALN